MISTALHNLASVAKRGIWIPTISTAHFGATLGLFGGDLSHVIRGVRLSQPSYVRLPWGADARSAKAADGPRASTGRFSMRWMLVALVAGVLAAMVAIVRGWGSRRPPAHTVLSDRWIALHREGRPGTWTGRRL